MALNMKAFVKEDSFYLKKNILYDVYQEVYKKLTWTKNTFYVKHSQGVTAVDINDLIFLDELRDKKIDELFK
jgi:hypothetical protein